MKIFQFFFQGSNIQRVFISFNILCLVLLLFSYKLEASSLILSTFDENNENWSIDGGSLTHSLQNGNPNGYIKLKDTKDTFMSLSAPDMFHGDLSEFIGGKLSFDAKMIFRNGSVISTFGTVEISNGYSKVVLDIAETLPSTDKWTSYSASLVATEWDVSDEKMQMVLSNVTSITINLEADSKVSEEIGFDNFYISKECIVIDSDEDGVPDQWDKCPNTPEGYYTNKYGCYTQGLYTEEQMNNMVKAILTWGDINDDKKIDLTEAIHALRVTSGVTEPEMNQ